MKITAQQPTGHYMDRKLNLSTIVHGCKQHFGANDKAHLARMWRRNLQTNARITRDYASLQIRKHQLERELRKNNGHTNVAYPTTHIPGQTIRELRGE